VSAVDGNPASRTGRRMVVAVTGLLLALGGAGSVLSPANFWGPILLVPASVLGLAAAAVGWVLLGVPRLRRAALLWVVGGLLMLAAVVGGGGWLTAPLAERLGLVGVLCVLPLAVVAFPGPMPPAVRVVVVPVLLAAGAVVAMEGNASLYLGVVQLVVCVAVLGAVWWRFERGLVERRPGPERDALRWLALGLATTVLVAIPVAFTRYVPAVVVGASLSVLVTPAAVILGARPPGTVDVRVVAARTGGLLLTLLVGFALFAGVVSGFGSVGVELTSPGSLGLVAIVVAAVFEPIRRVVDRAAERLLFGDRLDPVGAASRFAAELSAADDPDAALRQLRAVLNLPYAAVIDVNGQSLAASGRPSADGEFSLPLTAGGDQFGELRLGLRPGETGPSGRDRPVLRIVAPALAQALRARSLTADVAASRERVVTAVEEDRRRLRRDLHDGLGPTLTGVAYATDAARNLLRSDPGVAEELLTGARADTGTAIAEVRRLVDGLRPAVLDQLGLVPALQQQAAQLRGRDGHRILVVLDLAVDLPELNAATEVAVFRIVTEALTNVARHAASPTARVRLTLTGDDVLLVEVGDAGSSAAPWVPGVGLQSMRERVEQLGGALTLRADGTGGLVRATLPLPRSDLRSAPPDALGRPEVAMPDATTPGAT
jgi:two-component system NarL family sensor kinase